MLTRDRREAVLADLRGSPCGTDQIFDELIEALDKNGLWIVDGKEYAMLRAKYDHLVQKLNLDSQP